uniref:AraC family transcriptional regulator n=1 Tax=Thermosporothrix sp. COM3 TaxID=2490863 RepID=A0A455SKA9_9CHLR|nr:AraC family transcriptional regulator [Thermosporothrix sp. COM3]
MSELSRQDETPAPPAGLLLAGHFVEKRGYYARRRAGTRDWLLFYTRAGEGRFRLDNQTWKSGEHGVVLLAPGVPHDYAAVNDSVPWDFYWSHFWPRPHWIPWLRLLPQVRPGFVMLSLAGTAPRQRLQGAWERVLLESRLPGAYQEELALNALEEVILLIVQSNAKDAGRTLDPRIELVLQHCMQQLSNPPSIARLAELVALSPSRLAHLFKAQTGDSLAATLLKLRLHHAARLLEFTGLQIREVARQTGFQSPFHFSHQFKLYYGLSPTLYRKRHTRS